MVTSIAMHFPHEKYAHARTQGPRKKKATHQLGTSTNEIRGLLALGSSRPVLIDPGETIYDFGPEGRRRSPAHGAEVFPSRT